MIQLLFDNESMDFLNSKYLNQSYFYHICSFQLICFLFVTAVFLLIKEFARFVNLLSCKTSLHQSSKGAILLFHSNVSLICRVFLTFLSCFKLYRRSCGTLNWIFQFLCWKNILSRVEFVSCPTKKQFFRYFITIKLCSIVRLFQRLPDCVESSLWGTFVPSCQK